MLPVQNAVSCTHSELRCSLPVFDVIPLPISYYVSLFLPRIDILLLWTSTLPERLRSGTDTVLYDDDTRHMSVCLAVAT
jgi:hypothetical protein